MSPAERSSSSDLTLTPRNGGRQYSKGNRQKVAIVAALSSHVELLILDEPTSGLDPLMENVFQEVVGEAKSRGASVLLSSHVLAEVETLADRVSIIREGKTVETGTLAELRGHARTAIHATLDRAPEQLDFDAASLHDVHIDGLKITATSAAHRVAEAVAALSEYGIAALTVEPPSLESLFLRLYEGREGTESDVHPPRHGAQGLEETEANL